LIIWISLAIAGLLLAAGGLLTVEIRRRHMHRWLGAWFRGGWQPTTPTSGTRHLMFCFVDHYEPQFQRPGIDVERARVERWRRDYPKLCAGHRDADGRPPIHTFFFPEEEYRAEHLDALAELCRGGMGEIEVHLHHHFDNEASFREKLQRFTRQLVDRHDALPVDPATGQPRWAFIHGNWALDNCGNGDEVCGINNELVILREEGCYADFTLPAAPDPAQTRTINQIYYATDDPDAPNSHDTGERVVVGGRPVGDLMIIQGPLRLDWRNRKLGVVPRIENSDVRTTQPPSAQRVDDWVQTGIHVPGRPEWIFVKVHTHGAPERDVDVLLGEAMGRMHDHLETKYNDGRDWKLHYVSAREMYNIIKAAEDGLDGDPGAYRDHVLPKPGYRPYAGTPS
jgi:hypothetical protein